MTCHNCRSECRKFGKHRNGLGRYQCRQCKRTFTEAHSQPLGEMYTSVAKAEEILNLLLEGCSISTIERVTGAHHGTILKILVIVGEKCERVMAEKIRNVQVRDVELDEVWSYIGKKQKRVRPTDDPNLGDAYTFVAIERHSKLVLNFTLGKRDQRTTDTFIQGLRQAT